jgi:hypothetical protein
MKGDVLVHKLAELHEAMKEMERTMKVHVLNI